MDSDGAVKASMTAASIGCACLSVFFIDFSCLKMALKQRLADTRMLLVSRMWINFGD